MNNEGFVLGFVLLAIRFLSSLSCLGVIVLALTKVYVQTVFATVGSVEAPGKLSTRGPIACEILNIIIYFNTHRVDILLART